MAAVRQRVTHWGRPGRGRRGRSDRHRDANRTVPGCGHRPAEDGGVTLPELGSGLPDVVLRVGLVYLFLVVVLRISGKREVGQMSILELIVVLLISDAVQNSMVGDNFTIWAGPVAVLTLLGLDYGLNRLIRRSRALRTAIEGEPRLLIRDGRLLRMAVQ